MAINSIKMDIERVATRLWKIYYQSAFGTTVKALIYFYQVLGFNPSKVKFILQF